MADKYELIIQNLPPFQSGKTVETLDITTLAYDIKHVTSLEGQPGKLTFCLREDPKGLLAVGMGDRIVFKANDIGVFVGYVFTAQYDGEEYKITCYDQMRYLRNEILWAVTETNPHTLWTAFEFVCGKLGVKHKAVNKIVQNTVLGELQKELEINDKVFSKTSYFNILQFFINETNRCATKKQAIEDARPVGILVGARVGYNGDALYSEQTLETETSSRMYLNWLFDGDFLVEAFSKDDTAALIRSDLYTPITGWCRKDLLVAVEKKQYKGNIFCFIRDNFGTLELSDIETNYKQSVITEGGVVHGMSRAEFANLYGEAGLSDSDREWLAMGAGAGVTNQSGTVVIGNGSLMTGFDFSISIDKQTYNEIWVTTTVKNEENKAVNLDVAEMYDGTSGENAAEAEDKRKRWGLLRLIMNSGVNSADTSDEAKNLIKDVARLAYDIYSAPTRTLKIKSLGIVGLNAGDSFWLKIPEINADFLVYITAATHTYGEDLHTMDLEVCTNREMAEVLRSGYE